MKVAPNAAIAGRGLAGRLQPSTCPKTTQMPAFLTGGLFSVKCPAKLFIVVVVLRAARASTAAAIDLRVVQTANVALGFTFVIDAVVLSHARILDCQMRRGVAWWWTT